MSATGKAENPWGVLYVVFGLLAFAIQDAIVKDLSATYPVLQLLTIRSAVVFAAMVLLILIFGHRALFKTSRPGLLMIRGLFAFLAFTMYYLALSKMPFADGAAIYMTGPLFVTALSVPLLGERVGIHRALAVVVGFVAAVVMINPGSSVFQAVALLPLFSAMVYAFIPIINRKVGRSQHALTMGFYTTSSYLLLCLLASLLVHSMEFTLPETHLFANLTLRWHALTMSDFIRLTISGLFFVAGLLGLTQSYRLLPVSVVAPFEYSYLLWATVIGYVAFAELPEMRTVLGGLIVIACGCYIAFRESRATTR